MQHAMKDCDATCERGPLTASRNMCHSYSDILVLLHTRINTPEHAVFTVTIPCCTRTPDTTQSTINDSRPQGSSREHETSSNWIHCASHTKSRAISGSRQQKTRRASIKCGQLQAHAALGMRGSRQGR
eukprot:1161655-Pelagomonas_calceolata.AAC.5